MERIGKHVFDIDDIKHIIYDAGFDVFLIVTRQNHSITNVKLSEDEYEQLLAELGVAEPEEYPHTDVQFDGDHFVTEPQT